MEIPREVIEDYKNVLAILDSEMEQLDERLEALDRREREITGYKKALDERISSKPELKDAYNPLQATMQSNHAKVKETRDFLYAYRSDLKQHIDDINQWLTDNELKIQPQEP